MAAKKKWVKKLSAFTIWNTKANARARARRYARGEMRHENFKPSEYKAKGRYMTAQDAARTEYRYQTRALRDTSGQAQAERHYARKTRSTETRKRTSTRGRWTLRQANVARGKGGRFTKRQAT